eukprot:SAG22_NODE_1857_length_3437_cov_3.162073_6_plen_123_part_01
MLGAPWEGFQVRQLDDPRGPSATMLSIVRSGRHAAARLGRERLVKVVTSDERAAVLREDWNTYDEYEATKKEHGPRPMLCCDSRLNRCFFSFFRGDVLVCCRQRLALVVRWLGAGVVPLLRLG